MSDGVAPDGSGDSQLMHSESEKLRLLTEVKKEINDWAWNAFRIAIIVLIIGAFGFLLNSAALFEHYTRPMFNEMFDNAMKYTLDEIKRQGDVVDKKLEENRSAREELAKVIDNFRFINDTEFPNLETDFRELEENIKIWEENYSVIESELAEIVENYEIMRDGTARVSDRLFTRFGSLGNNWSIIEIENHYLNERLKEADSLIEKLGAHLSKSVDDKEISEITRRYNLITHGLQNQRQEVINNIRINAKYRIIIYTDRGHVLDNLADSMVLKLRGRGFVADHWYPSGNNYFEHKADMEASFKRLELPETLGKPILVYHPASQERAELVRQAILEEGLLSEIELESQVFIPDSEHLDLDGRAYFQVENVMVMYYN